MKQLLDNLQRCIESRFPGTAARLNPGASDAQIDAFERAIGCALPVELRALYRWHDGQSTGDGPYVIGLFFGLPFLPLASAIDHWRLASAPNPAWSAAYEAEAAPGYSCLPSGTVKQASSNPAWIPLADDASGAYLGLDLDPDKEGAVGQVISFGGKEFIRVQIATSLALFLTNLLDLYETDQYELVEQDDDEFSIDTVGPRTSHFLDYVRLRAQGER